MKLINKASARIADIKAQIKESDDALKEIRREHPELFKGGRHRGR